MKIAKRNVLGALTLAITAMLLIVVISTLAGGYSTGELLVNGGFEDGFTAQNGCGMVGDGWGCFNTGGKGGYGFYDEGWGPAVAKGSHAQLIEINTKKDFGDQNRTAGIYQTVKVVKGETYELSLKALMRANDLAEGGDPWRYVMLVGVSHDGGVNWADANVQEIDVGPIQDRLNPTGFYDVKLKIKAEGDEMTIFIAGRMKWGDWNREVDFDVDEVSLKGALPQESGKSKAEEPVTAVEESGQATTTIKTTKLVCDGDNLLTNGNFEKGFKPIKGTGRYWKPFNNGGAAAYGYYDDQWPPVVANGKHAQLLEINTYGRDSSDTDRLIGIYQTVKGLKKGETYQLSLSAMIREAADHSDEDPYRYEVYWGFNNGTDAIADTSELDGWYGIPVSDIYLRTDPGPYSSYSTTFEASSKQIVLYLFGLKKWATVEREVNFDFDWVQLRKCRTITVEEEVPIESTASDTATDSTSVCTYIVMWGDTLTSIAEKYNTTVATLVEMNDIKNPSLIYNWQPLQVPCDSPADNADPPDSGGGDADTVASSTDGGSGSGDKVASQTDQPKQKVKDVKKEKVHKVKKGETLGQIAQRYGTTVKVLQVQNHIKNANKIRPGQKIKVSSK
ncbi:MAG: LysM peptidoglycan-binding domain-containing protein [Chloroflexi bacterium]|nr:LysM peptidoglycan-binding domain-containing protein [Chloroflexota bacterium]